MRIDGEVRVDRSNSDVVVVELLGEHDFSNVAELRAALEQALDDEGGIVIDLCEATFIDSHVIAALFDTQQILEHKRRQLVVQIRSASPLIRVLEITELTDAVPVVGERAEAVTLARQQREQGRSDLT